MVRRGNQHHAVDAVAVARFAAVSLTGAITVLTVALTMTDVVESHRVDEPPFPAGDGQRGFGACRG